MTGRAIEDERGECILCQIVRGDSRLSRVSNITDYASLRQYCFQPCKSQIGLLFDVIWSRVARDGSLDHQTS